MPLYPETGICIPRRSGKSSAIWAVAIGRCMNRDDYMVVVTAATGLALDKYAKGINATLDKFDPDPDHLRRKFYKGAGRVHWEWTNGSQLWIVPPRENSYRGDAAALLIFDEAQSHDPETSDDLVAAAEPLTDTVPEAQLIVAGTAGSVRAGMLWGQLEAGRNDPSRKGIVEYAAEPDADPEDDATLLAVHPGITSGLTTLEKIAGRRLKMSLPAFAREYCGQWPESGSVRAIDIDQWEKAAGEFAERPEHFALGFEVKAFTGDTTAVVAAWRDENGVACIEVLAHRAGSDWAPRFVHDLVKKHRVQCRHDMSSSNVDVADRLSREPATRSRVAPTSAKDTSGSQSRLEREIRNGMLRHADQPSLNAAVDAAVWSPQGHRSGRYLRARAFTDDITPLIAAAQALWAFDQAKEKGALLSVVQVG